ncbi:MAG TPA: DinB family protein, partial [Aggregatilineales bacterium]|nr:DinB family protein [Aggregatilineales bacterium]
VIALQTYSHGENYTIPDLGADAEAEDYVTFNALMRENHTGESGGQIFAFWQQTREDFIKALQPFTDEAITTPHPAPWVDTRPTTVASIIKIAFEHEEEHIADIVSRA